MGGWEGGGEGFGSWVALFAVIFWGKLMKFLVHWVSLDLLQSRVIRIERIGRLDTFMIRNFKSLHINANTSSHG